MSENDVIAATSTPSNSDEQLAVEGAAFARGGLLVVFGTLTSQAIALLGTVWMARKLGPDQYGVLTLSLSVLAPVSILALLGLHKAIVRFLPVYIGKEEGGSVKGVLYSALIMSGFASIALAVLILLLSPFIASNVFQDIRMAPALGVLAFMIPFTVMTTIASSSTRGLKVMRFSALIQIARPFFRLLAWAAVLYFLTNLLGAAIFATLVGIVFTAFFALGLAYLALKDFLKGSERWEFKNLLVYSWPIIFATVVTVLSVRIDRLILGTFFNTTVVGIYSVAVALKMNLRLIHGAAVQSFSPIVADAYNRVSTELAEKLYMMVTRWESRLTFLMATGMILLGQELISIFGKGYSEALSAFIVLAVGVYIGTLPGPTGAFLQMTNRQKLESINALLLLILGSSLQIGLVMWMGWIGVAFGVLVTAAVLNIVQVLEIRYIYGFQPFQNGHLMFSVLSLVTLVFVAFAGWRFPLSTRLMTLGLVLTGTLVFVYLTRDPSDMVILRALKPRKGLN